jgi:hypothetical protein
MAATACENTLAPEAVAGTYVLTAVGNNRLPTELYRTDYVIVRVLADTLRLNSDGTATSSTNRSVESRLSGVPDSGSEHVVTPAHYLTRSGRVEITFDCPPNASCIAGPHLIGVPSIGGLDVDFVIANNAALSYRRIPIGL